MSLRKIHFTSGVIMTLFICLHLFNHLWSLLGPEAHIQLMEQLRIVYRHPIAETILLLAAIVQIISGAGLILNKKWQNTASIWLKLQVRSGAYLAIFLLIHLSAVIGGRWILELDTNFYFGVAGLNTFPFNLFFIPYYGLAIIAFFSHLASIHRQKMKWAIFGLSPIRQAWGILLFGILITPIIFYGLTNHFSGFTIPPAYHVLIGK